MFVREGRRVEREEGSRRGEERKSTTPLPRISPPVSTAADKAQRRFSSRSPTTPQPMTHCSLLLAKSSPTALDGRTRLRIADLRGSSSSEHVDVQIDRPTERRHSRPRSLPHRFRSRYHSDETHLTSFSSFTRWVGAVWRWQAQLAMLESLWSEQQKQERKEGLTMRVETFERTNWLSAPFRFSRDCSRFLNWKYHRKESQRKKAIVFRSLVATVKLQPALDASLEAKAVQFLKSPSSTFPDSADGFLNRFGRNTDEPLTNFVQSILVLISSTNPVITTAALEMLRTLFVWSSTKSLLALVQADLIPQIINTLNLQSLSFEEVKDMHINLMKITWSSLALSSPDSLSQLGIEDRNEQQAVRTTVFQQVIAPSEKDLCPYHRPTMDFVLLMPVFLAIPSCFTFFEEYTSIWRFLYDILDIQREWYETRGEVQQQWRTVQRMLRMEGIEDGIEEKSLNYQNNCGSWIVTSAIGWNNLEGMNRRWDG
ncbi:hypothetical protein BLNAU_21743 [Blattamonas nauphoetae]|uniref:Uncharacterized protein n=1 Tax=Blattamonas nauphoetae TaxID=2049346 RepID=A0ABQ9WVF3_9EUKA|nr:hypothetical protein BLNAU_21743 [Blattamonas nauphoetae]